MRKLHGGLIAALAVSGAVLGGCASSGGAAPAEATTLLADRSVTEVVVLTTELFEQFGYTEVNSSVTPNLQNYGAVSARRADGGRMKVNVRSVDGPAEIVVNSFDPRDSDAEARVHAALVTAFETNEAVADTSRRVRPRTSGGGTSR